MRDCTATPPPGAGALPARGLALLLVLLLVSPLPSAGSECPGVAQCMHFSADVVIGLDDYPKLEDASSIAGCQEICKSEFKKFYKFRPESASGPSQCSCFDNCVTISAGVATVGSIAACNPGMVFNSGTRTVIQQQPPVRRQTSMRGKRYGPCTIRFATCPPRCPGRSICLRDGAGAACCCVGLTPNPMIYGGKMRDCSA